LGVHTSLTTPVLWTKDDIVDVTWLLDSSFKLSRQKRVSAFFFYLAASLAPAAISTAFPPKVTFLGPLTGLAVGMASFAEASTILLAFWAEVEGPEGRTGASGVDGIIAGDGFALGGFWPAIFLLLCIKSQIRIGQVRDDRKLKD
jgi:hypothetical protein